MALNIAVTFAFTASALVFVVCAFSSPAFASATGSGCAWLAERISSTISALRLSVELCTTTVSGSITPALRISIACWNWPSSNVTAIGCSDTTVS